MIYAVGLALLAIGALVALRIGQLSMGFTWGEIADWATGRGIDPRRAAALGQVRLPRILMAILAGATLALAGAIFQALLRNPLAEPYTLGVSGGATFGAVLALFLINLRGYPQWATWMTPTTMAALAGAGVSVAIVALLASAAGRFSNGAIVLAGVTLNLIFGAMILLLQHLSDYTQAHLMIRWMMGGLDVVEYREVGFLAAIFFIGAGMAIRSARALDLMAVDPLTAATLGVRVGTARRRLLVMAAMAAGAVAAFAGPIGFVGLIVPHAARMTLGASHERLLPASIVAGGIFLLACDLTSMNAIESGVPIGVITSMLGGPFFVYLLLRRGGGVWVD
jgi:iron complex transport system permease protein